MTAIVIAHKTADFNLNTEGMTQLDVQTAIKAAGYALGQKSIAALMNGSKTEAGDFMVKTEAPKADVKKAAADAAKAAADAAKAAKAKTDEKKPAADAGAEAPKTDKPAKAKGGDKAAQEAAMKAWGGDAGAAPESKGKGKTLTPEQKKLASDVEKAIPTKEKGAPAQRGTDWSTILPQSPVAVKAGSKGHQLFLALCEPEGATKKELMEKFNWTAGTLGGLIHWEPKAKGYFLNKIKRANGEMAYCLTEIGTGNRYKPEDIITTDQRIVRPAEMREAINSVVAASKATRQSKIDAGMTEPTPADAPKETAPAAETQKAPVKVAKDAPVGVGASVTRRSNKRNQPQA